MYSKLLSGFDGPFVEVILNFISQPVLLGCLVSLEMAYLGKPYLEIFYKEITVQSLYNAMLSVQAINRICQGPKIIC